MSPATGYTGASLWHFHVSGPFSMLNNSHHMACGLLANDACWRYSHSSSVLATPWFTWSLSQLLVAPPPCFPVFIFLKILLHHSLHNSPISHSLLLQELRAPINSVHHMSLSLWNHCKRALPPSLSIHKRIKANYQSDVCLYFSFSSFSFCCSLGENMEICRFGLILLSLS